MWIGFLFLIIEGGAPHSLARCVDERYSSCMLRLFRKWFLTGLVAVAPVAITLSVVIAVFDLTDSILQHISPEGYEPSKLLGFHVPGLGLAITLIGIAAIGAFVSNFLGSYLVRWWDKIISRLPVVNTIYGAIKQVLNSVLSDTGRSFREVVYVEFPQPGQYAMGFLVGPADHVPVIDKPEPMVTVFIPMVPLPTTGFLITLPASKLLKSGMTVEEGLKLSVTMGLVKSSPATK